MHSTVVIVAWAGFIIALERLFPYDRQRFFRREFWTDLLWFSTLFSLAMGWVAYALIHAIDHRTGWSQVRGLRAWPIGAQVGVSLLSHDLFIYVFHRMMHGNRYLWRIHEAHHSVLDVDWIGGSRGHVIENLITGTAELAPIMLFMSPEVAVLKSAIDACWGMWIHSNVDVSLGPLDYVINGPRMHRWHHAREVHNVNFATKFAFWDWLFKTAYAPKNTRPMSYGLDEPFPSNIVVQQLFAFRSSRGRSRRTPLGAEASSPTPPLRPLRLRGFSWKIRGGAR
jgi:sterol desaturase/sphingolipid hydroxylase (fatty acid hydroxylase superfamily)